MKIKTSELSGVALDWAVWKIEHSAAETDDELLAALSPFSPSTDWSQGGPIIEREKVKVFPNVGGKWSAQTRYEATHPLVPHPVIAGWSHGAGETILLAAMRCYVASKIGDVVDVPDELMGE